MTDSTLTREQTLSLLRKLSNDDAFRAQFEAKPAKALHDLGVPAETIVNLSAACVSPCKLADKNIFADASKKVDDDIVGKSMTMNVPQLKVSR